MMADVARSPSLPQSRPPGEATLWAVSLSVLVAVFLLDIFTPASLAVGTLLCASVAFAALGASKRVTLTLTLLCVLANVLAGILNGVRDGVDGVTLANRAVSIVAVLLVGVLTLRAREAASHAARIEEDGRQLERERALRRLAEDVGGPLGQAEFVERAAHALQRLTGAASVEIGGVDRAVLRPPHARAASPEHAPPSRLNTRLPLEFLAHPVGAGDVWAADGGQVFLARLRRPADSDLLLILTRPATPPNLTGEAVASLQPMLERTALLDDLRVQQERLAEHGELLRDLVYAFSHDLRTPLLANAMNMTAALRGAYGPLPEDYRSTLRNGLEANETLLALADQLLLVAKYESGEAAGEDIQSVNLRELTLSVLNDLRGRAGARGITLDADLTGVQVPGRQHDLRRALQNLLDNAVKFSPPGGTVRVTLYAQDDEARVTVQDEGPGVSAERQARLFQRFRGGGAGRGTGLGLYLTRRIAEAHGGQVSYSRSSTARSLFTLTLRLDEPHG